MKQISVQCPAKINLTLGVLGKRADGYHEIESIMQSITLVDNLNIESRSTGIEIISDHPDLPTGKNNLIYQAVSLLTQYSGITRGVKINLKKQIPVAAGLGGGSSDAAGTLRGLNKLWDLNLSQSKLKELGGRLGSDIPFCIQGGIALARGRGEKLTPLKTNLSAWLVLVKPPVEVSTAQIYQNLHLKKGEKQPFTQIVIDYLKKGNLTKVGENLVNVLEKVTINLYPEIGEIKSEMLKRGAIGALMSGSGPTVFGLVEDEVKAQRLAEVFRDKYSEVYIAKTLPGDFSN